MSSMEKYIDYSQPERELSARSYNLIIGGMLTWAFALMYLICSVVTPQLTRAMYRSPESYSTMLLMGLIGYLILSLCGSRMLRSDSVGTCVVGFHMISVPVSLLVSVAVIGYSSTIVIHAALLTAAVTLLMTVAAAIRPDAFAGIGRGLVTALIAVIITEFFAVILFRSAFMSNILDNIVVLIMALFIGFDWARANSVPRTTANAVSASGMLFLDIVNIFLRVLRIMGRNRD